MTDAVFWIGWVCVVVNAFTFGLLMRRIRAFQRAYNLLMRIAVDAYVLQHAPVWAAWSGTLGEINVEISTRPRRFGREP